MKAKKHLGQNFLSGEKPLLQIRKAINASPTDIVIEIGPGHGELTSVILRDKPKKIYIIEKDSDLWPKLEEFEKEYPNLFLIKGDIREKLETLVQGLKGEEYKVVGNIPYYLTSHLLSQIGKLAHKPTLSVFTIQKEVAERIVQVAPHMNRLAAAVQGWGEPKICGFLSREFFSPVPKVDSAIISIASKNEDFLEEKYEQAINILFQQPRKNIANNVKSGLPDLSSEKRLELIQSAQIDPLARPQNLSREDIARFGQLL